MQFPTFAVSRLCLSLDDLKTPWKISGETPIKKGIWQYGLQRGQNVSRCTWGCLVNGAPSSKDPHPQREVSQCRNESRSYGCSGPSRLSSRCGSVDTTVVKSLLVYLD